MHWFSIYKNKENRMYITRSLSHLERYPTPIVRIVRALWLSPFQSLTEKRLACLFCLLLTFHFPPYKKHWHGVSDVYSAQLSSCIYCIYICRMSGDGEMITTIFFKVKWHGNLWCGLHKGKVCTMHTNVVFTFFATENIEIYTVQAYDALKYPCKVQLHVMGL